MAKGSEQLLSWLVLTALALGAAGIASGCGPSVVGPLPDGFDADTYAHLQTYASRNLGCDKAQMAYSRIGPDRHVFTGCGRDTEYLILHSPDAETLGGYGIHTYFLPSPTNEVSYILDCPREELAITRIDPTTYGVEGCGSRATYLAVDTPTGYTWVANEASEPER